MQTQAIQLCAKELRDAASTLDAEASSMTVDRDALLNALRCTMFAVHRLSYGCGLVCETGEQPDEWTIRRA